MNSDLLKFLALQVFILVVMIVMGFAKDYPVILLSVPSLLIVLLICLFIFKRDVLQSQLNLWLSLSLLIGEFTNPVVLGFIYFLILSPFAIVLRFFNRDPLSIRNNKKRSYWIKKEKIDFSNYFKDQF